MDEHAALTPGQRIRARREALGLSPTDLAYKVGLSKQAIEKIEGAGATNYPKLPNALRIGLVLGLDPWEIAYGPNWRDEQRRLTPPAVSSDGTELHSTDELYDLVRALQAQVDWWQAQMKRLHPDIGDPPATAPGSAPKGATKRTRSDERPA